jgi:hypothetical protein
VRRDASPAAYRFGRSWQKPCSKRAMKSGRRV